MHQCGSRKISMLLLLALSCLVCKALAQACPELCHCETIHNQTSLSCNGHLNQHEPDCTKDLFLDGNLNLGSFVSIRCFNPVFLPNIILSHVEELSVLESNLTQIPFNFLANLTSLKKLNVSENNLGFLNVPKRMNPDSFLNFKALDLSRNQISSVTLVENNIFSKVQLLFLQHNRIGALANFEMLPSLVTLDISNNPFELLQSNLYASAKLKELYLRNVSSVARLESCVSCCNSGKCRILPQNLTLLDLSNNHLTRIPSRYGLLAGVEKLQVLVLKYNNISTVKHDSFMHSCYFGLKQINLAHNRLIKLDGNSFSYLWHLAKLDVSNNFLQHLPESIVRPFLKLPSQAKKKSILLQNNAWSCDCLQESLIKTLLKYPNNTIVITCKIPEVLQNRRLQSIEANQLTCEDAAFTQTQNVTVQEYKDARLICTTSGTPRSIVHWVTPKHEVITLDNPEQRDLYGLSEFGDILTVKSVRLSKTGHYKCFANNTISLANQTIALAVILSPTSTIVYLVVACGAFMVAIVLNSVNMVMYICEHLEIKRQYRKILQAQEEEEKQNPPIKSRSRFMDESIASLNANKHYGRYDFTCQQMFLDTVIKGAHSVKKTLYDARHSDFSANVWEYAANLRDRLHIEMPSGVQLPNISMPSISMPTITMPTISMPSIPTIQDININIEKLSTSMVQRSQTLASSVGSVFTLKRWMQQQNASDNESRDSDDNLAESPITHVRVDVHSPETGLTPHLLDDEPPTPPDIQPPALVELGLHQDQQKSNNNATEHPENIETDGEIYDVKPKVLRKQSLKECYAEKVVKFKPQEFYDESLAGEPFLPRLAAGTGDLTSPTGDVMSPLLCTVSGAVDERYSYETSV